MGIHANAGLHAEGPRITLLTLVHLRITPTAGVLARAWRGNTCASQHIREHIRAGFVQTFLSRSLAAGVVGSEGLNAFAFRLALPEPKAVSNFAKGNVLQIVSILKTTKYAEDDFENIDCQDFNSVFKLHLGRHYHTLLKLNFPKAYAFKHFITQKDGSALSAEQITKFGQKTMRPASKPRPSGQRCGAAPVAASAWAHAAIVGAAPGGTHWFAGSAKGSGGAGCRAVVICRDCYLIYSFKSPAHLHIWQFLKN